MRTKNDVTPEPSPYRLMGERQALFAAGFRTRLSAWPDPETGKLDMDSVDQFMTGLEEEHGHANVASVSAAFGLDGHITATDEVITIYVREDNPRLF